MATALGLALGRAGTRVRFATAAGLVTQLENAQQEHRLIGCGPPSTTSTC
ncbi:hypothetical protein [Fimbriiglobus ruber]